MKQKILITGGAGFIGSNLIPLLHQFDVYIVDSLSPQIHGENANFNALLQNTHVKECICADINDTSAYQHIIAEVDCIIHLAAYTGTGQSMYQIPTYFKNNVTGTAQLLQAVTVFGGKVKKIVLTSSRAVYGEGPYLSKDDQRVYPTLRKKTDLEKGLFTPIYNGHLIKEILPTTENDLLQPVSVYGNTKLLQEQLLRNFCFQNNSINSVIFRLQNVYGPGQSLSNPYTGILGIFSNLMRAHLPVEIYENGHIARDFVYIDDVVALLYKSIVMENFNGATINVGSGALSKLSSIASLLKEYLASSAEIMITPKFRLGDIAGNYSSNESVLSVTEFNSTSVDVGLKKYADWVMQSPLVSSNISKIKMAIQEMEDQGLMGTNRLPDR